MIQKATIAICTWNRASLLDRTLASLRQTPPQSRDWELIVVNNNCTDDTDAVVAGHADALPLKCIHETQQGKSYALNTALEQVSGDLILWTDDDVLLDGDAWVESHCRAAEANPQAAFFGGPVRPHFDQSPPAWLNESLSVVAPAFAAIDLGAVARPIDHPKDAPFGANFAIRAEVQRRYRYDTRLGRVGANEIRGEETAVVRRMLADGLQGWWNPEAPVGHIIPPERMTLDYIRRWYHGIGRTLAIMGIVGDAPPWRTWVRAMSREIRYRALRPWGSPEVWMKHMARASRRWGEYEQQRGVTRRAA